ncbi:hypothetical protein R3P93_17945 [Rhodococcus cerastii]|uniref:Uncharacterized protein n=1 Tax=Rhodococcus cerastii TaxID=908616 RepID=A0ABU4D3Z0_9NOCA|nr:hypothetical protein [Rhodococcus cerastii]MDV6304446.1 hypothetical protein [Rhodococcus cerastii]
MDNQAEAVKYSQPAADHGFRAQFHAKDKFRYEPIQKLARKRRLPIPRAFTHHRFGRPERRENQNRFRVSAVRSEVGAPLIVRDFDRS